MALVVSLRVSAHRGYRASQDTRDRLDRLAQSEARVMQVPLASRDHKAPRVKLERRVIQVLLEVKVPQVPRGLQGLLHVIGNSAFIRI